MFQQLEVKLAAPFELWSSIKLLFAARSTKYSLLDALALYPHCVPTVSPLCPHCTCWQLKLSAYTHGEGNIGGHCQEAQGWRFVDTDDVQASNIHTQSFNSDTSGEKPSRTGSHGQMQLNYTSCLGLTQLVQRLELLAY